METSDYCFSSSCYLWFGYRMGRYIKAGLVVRMRVVFWSSCNIRLSKKEKNILSVRSRSTDVDINQFTYLDPLSIGFLFKY